MKKNKKAQSVLGPETRYGQ